MPEIIPAPYLGRAAVDPEWIDPNGHMNVAYYQTVFDDGSSAFFEDAGIGWSYTEGGEGTVFIVASNIDYHRELVAEDILRVTTQLVAFDEKRLHLYHEVIHDEQNYLAASGEMLFLHIDLNSRRAAPFPAATHEILAKIATVHGELGRPERIGRVIEIG